MIVDLSESPRFRPKNSLRGEQHGTVVAHYNLAEAFDRSRTRARTATPWRENSRTSAEPLRPAAPVTRIMQSSIARRDRRAGSNAATACTSMPLHRRLHAFKNHRILKRHKVVESSLFQRVFAEKSQYPLRTDLLAARERDFLPRQLACIGDYRAHPFDELLF